MKNMARTIFLVILVVFVSRTKSASDTFNFDDFVPFVPSSKGSVDFQNYYKNFGDVTAGISTMFKVVFPEKSNPFMMDTSQESEKMYTELKKIDGYIKNVLDKKRSFLSTISEKNKDIIIKAWSQVNSLLADLITTIKIERGKNKKFMELPLAAPHKEPFEKIIEKLRKNLGELSKIKNSLVPGLLDIADTKELKAIIGRNLIGELQAAYMMTIKGGEEIINNNAKTN